MRGERVPKKPHVVALLFETYSTPATIPAKPNKWGFSASQEVLEKVVSAVGIEPTTY